MELLWSIDKKKCRLRLFYYGLSWGTPPGSATVKLWLWFPILCLCSTVEQFNKRLLDRDEVFEENCNVGHTTIIAADICIRYLFIMSKKISH